MHNESPRTHHLESYLDFTTRKEVYQPLIEFVEQQAATDRWRASARVLEVGCAAGAFLRHLASTQIPMRGAIGIDPDVEALKYAKAESVVCASATDLPFPDASFDLVFIVSVLHHLIGQNFKDSRQNWSKVFQEATRVLRPGGYLLVKEGLAVKRGLVQQVIFHVTRLLSTKHIEIRSLHIEHGEVLAFLTPSDMLRLCSSATGAKVAKYQLDPREGAEFQGILSSIWKSQTCSLTAILEKIE